MSHSVLSTYISDSCLQKIDEEAKRLRVRRAALVRDVLVATFSPSAGDEALLSVEMRDRIAVQRMAFAKEHAKDLEGVRILLSDALTATLIEWLARRILDGEPNEIGVLIGGGEILVNTLAVRRCWPTRDVPTVTRVGLLLARVAVGARRIDWPTVGGLKREVRYRSIDPRLIEEWFRQQGIDQAAARRVGEPLDLDTLRARCAESGCSLFDAKEV